MALSRLMYRGLVALRAPVLMRRIRPGAPVFCFHNVVPESVAGVGDASLHMPLGAFASMMDWLASSYHVVPLHDLADRARRGRGLAGLAAVTFDDAYRGVFELALPALAARGIPSTIFVVTGFPERVAFAWWDVLASRGLLGEERRTRALNAHRGLGQEILTEAELELGEGLPDVLRPAPWEQILASLGGGVDIGSHSVRHANLSVLGDGELEQELTLSRHEILERTGRNPEAVAYPYGLWNEGVVRAARRAGYATGLTLEGGPVPEGGDPLGLPRINVPAGISLDALACWATGLRLRRPW
jgi:peptidoglycan/xylan/chitin deacetylase (PgdA/CDA1 family)